MKDRQPLYRQVKDFLRDQIVSGALAAGAQVASEESLARTFGCSRLTVHRAMRELAGEGMLIRRRRAGTQVAPRDTSGVLIRVPRIRDEIEALGHVYRYELISRRHARPGKAMSAQLRVPPEHRMLQVVCRHWAGTHVFQHESRWINTDLAPDALDADFAAESANIWLLENVPYTCVDHAISARGADAADAVALGVAPGTALLKVERLTHLAYDRVTHATLLHPGSLYTLRSEVKR